MELKAIRCKCCGAKLNTADAIGGVITCNYCGSALTVANSTDDRVLNFLDSAELALSACRFDDALTAYKKAAELDKNEPEAYFGMALARYKIQYLKDEVTNRLQPICHEVTDKKFSDDPDYMRAYMKGSAEQRAAYESKAKEIDYIQGEFYKLKKSGLDYDCFVCVKVTDDKTGNRTPDCKSADDIYFALKGKGFKPFFSERELGGLAGADYEARILYALYSSECMLVVCGNEEYLQTKWVKNEYLRFLKLVNDEEKESDSITIVFSGKPIEKLPGKRGKIQGIDLKGLDALPKVEAFVDAHTPEAKTRREQATAARKREEEEQKARMKELEEQVKSLKNASGELSDEELLERMEKARAERERKKKQSATPAPAAEEIKEDEKPTAAPAAPAIHAPAPDYPTLKNYDETQFDIFGTVLVEYLGDKAVVKIPFGVTEIAKHAFVGKTGIKGVIIPDSVTAIDEEAFKDQRQIINLSIGNGVTAIGERAFYNCESLTNVTIPESVTTIGDYAFRCCENLTSITIPDSVTSIGRGVFSICSAIKSAIIGDGITSITSETFSRCGNLKNLAIGKSVTAIGKGAFDYCEGLAGVYITDLAAWCNIEFDELSNPLRYAKNLYLNSKLITELEIPQGVTEVKSHAFEYCESIKSSVISDSVASIGAAAFYSCKNLKNVTIGNSVTSIGDNAFSNCASLESITIPNSVTSIGDYAFCKCASLTSITIPDSVAFIGAYAFKDCNAEIKWGDNPSVKEINSQTFAGYLGESITIPDSVTSICSKVFSDCKFLKSIIIGNGLTSICDNAFERCLGLENVIIGNSVTSIGKTAFENCQNLTSVTIGKGVTSIGYCAFYDCTSLTNITIPDSVTSIGKSAFENCQNLTSLTIGKGVTSIGWRAFFGCEKLKSITIPDSVTSIGERVFYGCTSVKIYCKADKQPNGWNKDWNVVSGSNMFNKKRAKVVWGYKG